MDDDLVERLRSYARVLQAGASFHRAELMLEAAHEIERLRATWLANWDRIGGDHGVDQDRP